MVVVLLLCILVLLYLGSIAVVMFRKNRMPVYINSQLDCINAYSRLVKELDADAEVMSNEYYKELIEKDLGLRFYIYLQRDDMAHYNAGTYLVIRTIVIDNNNVGYAYCWNFAHEAMHLKHFILQEDFVCFETFKYLYEHEELHNVGVTLGLNILRGYYNGSYDVSDYIIDYLTKN